MISFTHRDGALYVEDGLGRTIIVTTDRGGELLVTFPDGAATSGLTSGMMFADEDDLHLEWRKRFTLLPLEREHESEEDRTD